MKNPTNFLVDLVDDLNVMAYCNKPVAFTIDTFDGKELTRAFDMVQANIQLVELDMSIMRSYPDTYDLADYKELEQSLSINNKVFTDLCLLQELMVDDNIDYASPHTLPKSIKTVSELLALQLESKAEGNPLYDEYYCNQLTSVLEELRNMIKEA